VRAGRPFTLELVGSGRSVAVPADRSALDAVRTVHPGIPYSCRRGFCGTCGVRTVPGGTMMALCVDRPDGPRIAVEL
jgi:ferredoxin